MAKYRYAGPGPVPDPENEIVHPGDVREFDEEPTWGPWDRLDEPEADEGSPELPSQQEASPAAPAPGLAAPSLTVPPAKEF